MKYAISCGHHLTALAAENVLKAGGNALDAAVAAFACSWVVEPCMSGPGGGGFAVANLNSKNFSIDFFTQTPKSKKPVDAIDFRSVEVDFGATQETFCYGLGSIAVPGAVDGLFALHLMGARLPMQELLQPAIEYANSGHTLVPFQHHDMVLLQDILKSSDRGRELFFSHDTVKAIGDEIRIPHLADFLDYLGHEGPGAFYHGEVAQKIAEACNANGGHLGLDDLSSYSTSIQKAHSYVTNGMTVVSNGLPSVGGKILEAILYRVAASNQEGTVSDVIEAMSYVHGMKSQWFEPGWNIKQGGTSHINIIDKKGDAVALSMSLGEGSGYFVEGTDIHLNNMLGEAALLPGGWHSWAPDSRLKSMMTPILAFDSTRDLQIATGSGGASRIPFMIAQVLMNLHYFDMDLKKSVEAPRIHWDGLSWQSEPGYQVPVGHERRSWNHWPDKNLYFGGVHTSVISKGTYAARGDHRREGASVYSN